VTAGGGAPLRLQFYRFAGRRGDGSVAIQCGRGAEVSGWLGYAFTGHGGDRRGAV
jgi:hypothetical protein